MCGIAGIVSKDKKIDQARLKAMTDVISHRGPDGEGHWINNNGTVGLGHRRLSIIDLSANGHQPMHYADGGLTITFNGEIYNYIELRDSLQKKGYTFRSGSDTEVLLAMYKEMGESCLQELNGMFAFAIWDEKKGKLFCARDRFGEKPFYYFKNGEQFIFASEIKQFWAAGIKKEVSSDHLREYLLSGNVMNEAKPEETFYKNIYSLKAGHYLLYDSALAVSIKPYWQLSIQKTNSSMPFEEAMSTFKQMLLDSVRLRLRADVPVGSSLSGGLDSSCIVYMINRWFLVQGQQQHSFSARFSNFDKDEGEYIDAIVSRLKDCVRHDVFITVEGLEEETGRIIHAQDEPFQSSSIFAQYKVMQLASQNGIKVLMDGQGADELLGGYEGLYSRYLQQLYYNNQPLYKTEVAAFNQRHGKELGLIDFASRETVRGKLTRQVKSLLGREQAVGKDYFAGVLHTYVTGRNLQQLLRYADRNAMAHSVETRLPYLDHKLVEFVFTLPDEHKLKMGWPKYLLRKAFENEIPEKIIWREKKVGFEAPESKFLERDAAKKQMASGKTYLADKGLPAEKADAWQLFMTGSYFS